MALLALTLLVASPFLYCFSRLAILEPMLTAFALAALNLAIRLPRMRRPVWASVVIGLLFTLMMLTKTTALFLLPALGWAILLPFRENRKLALRCAVLASGTSAATFGLWMALLVWSGHFADYMYLFYVNTYPKPADLYWPFLSLWWSFHGGLWVDHILIPLAGLIVLGALLAWRATWARSLLLDPVFGALVLAVAGYILFMTIQNHPQPRYYAVIAVFCFILVAQGSAALLGQSGLPYRLGWAALVLAASAAVANGAWTLSYAAHPEYTFVSAARELTSYIDKHPNGNRLLVSVSGDEITLVTHLPTLCDDFGTEPSILTCPRSLPITGPAGTPPGTTSIPAPLRTSILIFRSSRWLLFTPSTTRTATCWCSSGCTRFPTAKSGTSMIRTCKSHCPMTRSTSLSNSILSSQIADSRSLPFRTARAPSSRAVPPASRKRAPSSAHSSFGRPGRLRRRT